MKKLIAVLAIVLMLGQSPFCYAGIPQDKQKHIGVAAGVGGAVAAEGVIWIVHKTW